jgi:hypothetical protein
MTSHRRSFTGGTPTLSNLDAGDTLQNPNDQPLNRLSDVSKTPDLRPWARKPIKGQNNFLVKHITKYMSQSQNLIHSQILEDSSMQDTPQHNVTSGYQIKKNSSIGKKLKSILDHQ